MWVTLSIMNSIKRENKIMRKESMRSLPRTKINLPTGSSTVSYNKCATKVFFSLDFLILYF